MVESGSEIKFSWNTIQDQAKTTPFLSFTMGYANTSVHIDVYESCYPQAVTALNDIASQLKLRWRVDKPEYLGADAVTIIYDSRSYRIPAFVAEHLKKIASTCT